jgi:hypothetical protein
MRRITRLVMGRFDGVIARVAVVAAVLSAPTPGVAEDGADDAPVEIHAFVSQGFLKSSDNNYLAESSGTGSFELTEVGVNVSRQLGDHLRVGLQLFARDLGPLGDYKATIDWAFLDYRWRDWLGVRAGRIKVPFGLYNDVADIDAAHPGVFLPQSVYPAQNRDFLLAQTGVEVYGYHDLGDAGALDYRAYAGTIFLDVEPNPASPFTVLRLAIPYVVGSRVLWETPVDGLRVGASVQALRLESDLRPAPSTMDPMPANVSVVIPAVLWVASADYIVDDFGFVAEYSRWHVDSESSDPMRFPESSTTSERAFGLATYRPRPWLQPGLSYAWYRPDVDRSSGKSARHHDAAALLRFDLGPNWIWKLEVHAMRGTAGLSAALNGVTRTEDLANRWYLFATKITAYF